MHGSDGIRCSKQAWSASSHDSHGATNVGRFQLVVGMPL